MARRNNQGRTTRPEAPDVPTPPPNLGATQDDFLSFVTPTDFVDLPSKGAFYPEGHPLHGVESVEIKHMTAKEEDILTSESLLRKGLAIDRLLQSLVIDKTLVIDDLLVGDKNALIVGARITGFGPEYMTSLTCPACDNLTEVAFNLDEIEPKTLDELPEDVTTQDDGTFAITLPTTGYTVTVRLLTGRDERLFAETVQKKKKMKLPESTATDLLKAILVSVEGRTDGATLQKFVNVMPVRDSVHLKKIYEQLVPNIDISHEFECETCTYGGRVDVPLTAEFFWPQR